MKTVTLDGKKMITRAAAHAYVQRRLNLPAYYGANLDALWDVLSTWGEPLHIRLVNYAAAEACLDRYAQSLLKVFLDAGRENPHIAFEVSSRPPRLAGRLPD